MKDPRPPTPSDQSWFWTDRWQRTEREAAEEITAGRVASFETIDLFLDDLDS
jgi:hypothetical protein